MNALCRCILICLVTATTTYAQYDRVRMDTVISFEWGSGQSVGQSTEFFPMNVLSGPDPFATDSTPSVDSREVCSIGLGGTIVLGLKNFVIVDGPGIDFVVFENAFIGPRGRVYAEPAQVSVSSDGISWYDFPFDSASLQGCAGITPTHGGDPFSWPQCGGDAFDIGSLGIDSVRFVRIHDVTSIVKQNSSHSFYDPTLSGFDLDVITVSHATRIATATTLLVTPRTTDVVVSIQNGSGVLRVFDVYGRQLQEQTVHAGITTVSLSSVIPTCLIVTLVNNDRLYMVKVLR